MMMLKTLVLSDGLQTFPFTESLLTLELVLTDPDPLLVVPDVDGDGTVTAADTALISAAIDQPYHPLFDVNADGEINEDDVQQALSFVGQSSSPLEQDIVAVTQDSLKYFGDGGLNTALADGFEQFTPEFKGHGIHYFQRGAFFEMLFKGKDIEPTDYFGLNYSPEGDLLAVFYAVFTDNFFESMINFYVDAITSGFTGDGEASFGEIDWGEAPNVFTDDPLLTYPDEESWHQHKAVYMSKIGTPEVVFEQDLTPEELYGKFYDAIFDEEETLFLFETLDLDAANAILIPGFWMMHAWVHTLNPDGVFAATNPLVSVDAPDEHGGHGGHSGHTGHELV